MQAGKAAFGGTIRGMDGDGTCDEGRAGGWYLVPIHKWLFCPISALREKFYPRNINYMPPVKFFARLDLDQNPSFLDGHYLT